VNDAPVANADAYSVNEGSDADGTGGQACSATTPMPTTPAAGLSAVQVTEPAHATSFTLNADGSFTYVHDGSETTTDSFTYKVCDNATSSLCSGTVMVSITVNPVNDAQ
jgi:VCBS repeat-containing protein